MISDPIPEASPQPSKETQKPSQPVGLQQERRSGLLSRIQSMVGRKPREQLQGIATWSKDNYKKAFENVGREKPGTFLGPAERAFQEEEARFQRETPEGKQQRKAIERQERKRERQREKALKKIDKAVLRGVPMGQLKGDLIRAFGSEYDVRQYLEQNKNLLEAKPDQQGRMPKEYWRYRHVQGIFGEAQTPKQEAPTETPPKAPTETPPKAPTETPPETEGEKTIEQLLNDFLIKQEADGAFDDLVKALKGKTPTEILKIGIDVGKNLSEEQRKRLMGIIQQKIQNIRGGGEGRGEEIKGEEKEAETGSAATEEVTTEAEAQDLTSIINQAIEQHVPEDQKQQLRGILEKFVNIATDKRTILLIQVGLMIGMLILKEAEEASKN